MSMKVQFKKNVLVEVQFPSGEIEDHQFSRFDELDVDLVERCGNASMFSTILGTDGNVYMHVPNELFTTIS
jgi:hypothetical protein